MQELKAKAIALENELADLYSMSEEAACYRYNTWSKQEAIDILDEELTAVWKQLEDMELAAENEYYKGWPDPAFRTMGDFDRLRV